jgi:hypothetical protein
MHETDDEAPKKEVENGVGWALAKDASRYQMSFFYQLTNYGQMLNVIVHSSFFHFTHTTNILPPYRNTCRFRQLSKN